MTSFVGILYVYLGVQFSEFCFAAAQQKRDFREMGGDDIQLMHGLQRPVLGGEWRDVSF
jgi:hypothetical protein